MEKMLLITMGWLFVVGGAIVLGILLELTIHRRKSKRLDESFSRMGFDVPEESGTSEEEEREFRRSA